MGDIKIRQLITEDAESYREIRLEMLRDNPEHFGDSYEDNLEYDLSFFEGRIDDAPIYGGFDGDSLVGVAGYFIQKGDKTSHKAMIWGVYVRPENRGHRLSEALIEEAIQDCRQYVEQALIHVSAENYPAIKIYQGLGFEEFGREPKARKIGNKYYDEIHMVKFLNK